MDLSIAALLAQDGVTNGAIYALLALALVLVFAVTRVIWVPSGEFVAFGTLTLAALQLADAGHGRPARGDGGRRRADGDREHAASRRAGTARGASSCGPRFRSRSPVRSPPSPRSSCRCPCRSWPRWRRSPRSDRCSTGSHFSRSRSIGAGAADRLGGGALRAGGFGLWFFGAEGSRTPPFSAESFSIGRST